MNVEIVDQHSVHIEKQTFEHNILYLITREYTNKFAAFGCAADTSVRQCSNKFGIALTYTYLCKQKKP